MGGFSRKILTVWQSLLTKSAKWQRQTCIAYMSGGMGVSLFPSDPDQ